MAGSGQNQPFRLVENHQLLMHSEIIMWNQQLIANVIWPMKCIHALSEFI
jgi:hypothetical protein